MSTRDRLSSSSQPPPTPIPTGKGNRSAVDAALSEYIDRSQVVPELSLPQNAKPWVPIEINYQSLKLRENQAIEMISKSISEHGVFLVTDHGGFSTAGELRSILIDNQWIFALLSPDHDDPRRGYNEKYVWSTSHNKLMLEKGKYVADKEGIFQILSQEMENVSTKLKEIERELSQVMSSTNTKSDETKLYIYRSIYNARESSKKEHIHDQESSQDYPSKYGFNLILPLEPAEFYSQSKQSSLRTKSDSVIVTIGKDPIRLLKPSLHGESVSLSIELKCSTSSTSRKHNIISLPDQIVIVIIFSLLYKIYHYILISCI